MMLERQEKTMSVLILYTSDDGQTLLQQRVEADSIWLSLEATVKESLTVQTEGARQAQRKRNLSHG